MRSEVSSILKYKGSTPSHTRGSIVAGRIGGFPGCLPQQGLPLPGLLPPLCPQGKSLRARYGRTGDSARKDSGGLGVFRFLKDTGRLDERNGRVGWALHSGITSPLFLSGCWGVGVVAQAPLGCWAQKRHRAHLDFCLNPGIPGRRPPARTRGSGSDPFSPWPSLAGPMAASRAP